MVSEQLRLRMLSATRRPTDITWLHSMYSCTSLNVSYLHLNIAFCLFDFRYLLVEKNPSLVKLYKEKMGQYLQRAEYIKKTVLDVPDQPASGGTSLGFCKPSSSSRESTEIVPGNATFHE